MVILGHQIGKAVIDALGLPMHTRSFTLRCAVGEPVTVECEYFPGIEVGSLEKAFAKYELVARIAPKAAMSVNFDAWLSERKESAHAAFMASHQVLACMDKRLFWRG
jgi:hypothetical protein